MRTDAEPRDEYRVHIVLRAPRWSAELDERDLAGAAALLEGLITVPLLQALPALHVRFVRVKLGRASRDAADGWEGWQMNEEEGEQ